MVFKTIKTPHILLPKEGTDMNAWAVIACDQFTSQLDYWDQQLLYLRKRFCCRADDNQSD